MTVNHFTDFANAEKLAHEYDAVISLGHKLGSQFVPPHIKYLFLDIDDVSFIDIDRKQFDPVRVPTALAIETLVDFIRELKPEDKLLIHCFAGYSRSAAGCIIAMCERDEMTPWGAIQVIRDQRIPDKLTPDPNQIMMHNYLMIRNERKI